MNEHGFQLDRTFGAVADYVAKFGREPLRQPWGTAAELAKSHLKRGRGNEHLTPFAMLELISLGHDELKPIFTEYATWFKGKHQLVWSAGLRSRLLENTMDKSDLEIAGEQEPEEEMVLLGQLSRRQWSVILKKEVRGELLEVAKSGNWQDVIDFLLCIDADNEPTLFLGNLTNKVSNGIEETNNITDSIEYIGKSDRHTQQPKPERLLPNLPEELENVVEELKEMINEHIASFVDARKMVNYVGSIDWTALGGSTNGVLRRSYVSTPTEQSGETETENKSCLQKGNEWLI